MSLSTPFIRRPVGTTLLTVAMALAGILAYLFLPVSPLPQVDSPTISVSASLPGASAETIASSVVTPLERQFGRIAGVVEMTSTSSLGTANVVLVFDTSRDINGAARDVQAAINAAAAELPANLPGLPSYRKVNPADAPIMILDITSDVYSRGQMYDSASTILSQKLSQIEGIGQVIVGGGALPAVRLELNPLRLNAMGLSLEDVRTFVGTVNVINPKGQVSIGSRTWDLATTDQLQRAAQYRPLVVKDQNGAAVRLEDLGHVVDSVEDVHQGGFANNKPAILLIIFRAAGANIIETVDRVRAIMPELQASMPKAMHLHVTMDRTTTIRASVNDVEFALFCSIALVILVVFIFLREARATFIPSVAVPVSLLGTFGVMYLCGYSIDNFSLMALAVATGFVVDDAIVVIENVARHLESGMQPKEAALLGAREIGFTVMSMSLSLIAVFIPIFFLPGYIGGLFREFAAVLAVAVAISMVISLTTTPMMCAVLLRPHRKKHGRIYRATKKVEDLLLDGYRHSLGWVLRHSLLMLVVFFVTLALTAVLFVIIPKQFVPEQDIGRLTGSVLADQDISSSAMRTLVARYAKIIMADPAVDNLVGFSGATNSARMFITLKDLNVRKIGASELIQRLSKKMSKVPGGMCNLQAQQDIHAPGGRASAALYQYTLLGDNLQELQVWSPKVTDTIKALPGLTDVQSDQQTHGLEAYLNVDRPTAYRLGLTATDVDNLLYDAFGQRQVSTTYESLNQYHVVMEVDPAFAQSPAELENIYAHTSTGKAIPLSAFAQYTISHVPLGISHQGQYPCVTISFNLAPGAALGTAITEIEDAVGKMNLPPSIRGVFAGNAKSQQGILSTELYLVATALAAVYLILGILYESLIHPITILSTLPSAGVGALLALLVCGTPFSLISLIGIILLIGIVKKNAIMMIDFALEAERAEKLKPRDAIYKACLLRFRPIVMTTMAAMLGGLPLALGHGTGAELRRPLGIAIVGGLAFSQLITLYTTPVIYLYLDRLRLWATGHERGGAVPPRVPEHQSGFQPDYLPGNV